MIFTRQPGLGVIPDWQFSHDPAVNIAYNPHMKYPADWPAGQLTVQPIGLVSQRTSGDPLAGLGLPMARWAAPRADLGAIEIFDSWAWRNRKWLVLGGAGLLGLAALSGVSALLR